MKKRNRQFGLLIPCILALILLVGFWTLPRVMAHRGYLSAPKVFALAGYTRSAEGALSWEKKDPEVTLTIDKASKTLWKNVYSFPLSGGLHRLVPGLYLEKKVLEEVLNVKISGSAANLSLEEEAADAAQLADVKIPLFAHAGGGISGITEGGEEENYTRTNSLEAIAENYGKGFRIMEIDIRISTDGGLCALHDWSHVGGKKLTLEEFLKTPMDGRFTSLLFETVLEQMDINRDLMIVLDLKSYNCTLEEIKEIYGQICQMAQRHGGDKTLQRIIPQVYAEEEYDWVMSAYPWRNMILTLYRMEDVAEDEVLSMLEGKENIQIVAMPRRWVTADFSEKLHLMGKKVYLYTVNDAKKMKRWAKKGVDGFYTDFVTPKRYESAFKS